MHREVTSDCTTSKLVTIFFGFQLVQIGPCLLSYNSWDIVGQEPLHAKCCNAGNSSYATLGARINFQIVFD